MNYLDLLQLICLPHCPFEGYFLLLNLFFLFHVVTFSTKDVYSVFSFQVFLRISLKLEFSLSFLPLIFFLFSFFWSPVAALFKVFTLKSVFWTVLHMASFLTSDFHVVIYCQKVPSYPSTLKVEAWKLPSCMCTLTIDK